MIELPWMRQIVVRTPTSEGGERALRIQLVLLRGHDGRPVLMVQPPYTASNLEAGELQQIYNQVMEHVRSRYPNVDIRTARRTPGDFGTSQDNGFNTGYSTFATGRSPVYYLDSNMHRFETPQGVMGNGLTPRTPGRGVDYPPGWSSQHDIR